MSPSLFRVLAGRATAPVPVEAHSRREAALIAAVRREERKRLAAAEVGLASRAERDAAVRAEHAAAELEAATKRVRARFADENEALTPVPVRAADSGCEEARARTVACYKENADRPAECSRVVAEFAECSRRLLG